MSCIFARCENQKMPIHLSQYNFTELLPGATTQNNQERRGDLNWQYAAEMMREEKRRRITAA
jgi:hypothetical protein